MPQKKHIMLSYQWDHQSLVTEVYHRLEAMNIPLWMDTQGGMKNHLNESMAEGVENAAAICCFLTPKYQDSVACKDELTYAKEQRVCIIPILVTPQWKPKGWLGFSIAGHKWIAFWDAESNMDFRIQQLADEIKLLVGDKLDCFPDMRQLKSSAEAIKTEVDQNTVFDLPESDGQDFDPNIYYRLTTQWQGPSKSLDIVNDGIHNNRLTLARTGNYSGQCWKLTPVQSGLYRLTTQWQGPDKSLGVFEDGNDNDKLILATTGNFRTQYWQITSVGDGYYRLTTQSQGPNKSLDVVNDDTNNDQLILADTGNYSGQYWRITPI